MSWIQKLYETYNNCQSFVGYSDEDGKRPLLPICHISAQANVEIVIDTEGNFKRAHVITDPKEAITIIPATEGSASRSGKKPEGHSLCDQLQYVAGDFIKFGGVVTIGYQKDPEEPFREYISTLRLWCDSIYYHPFIEAVLKYVQKKSVVNDLVTNHIMYIGPDGKFLAKKDVKRDKSTIDIFSTVNQQQDAFVRWVVEIPNVMETRVWKDRALWESWINFYLSSKQKEPVCLVTGEDAVLTNNHPKYIRAGGDGAKLISSNDERGFTFRGRFLNTQQAVSVSLEASQKAHNALIWLISRQGKVFYKKGEDGRIVPALTIIAWATKNQAIPQPINDPFDFLGINALPKDCPVLPDTAQDIALKLTTKINGYKAEIDNTQGIQIIGLDSASRGRMAITYYQEMHASDYLDRLNRWHKECAWIHRYRYQQVYDERSGKIKTQYYVFVGAPAPVDIAEAAYGHRQYDSRKKIDIGLYVDDKLKQVTIARLLPCIIENQPIPRDLVEMTIRHALNRISMEPRDWDKTLSIACALFKKRNLEEDYKMSLEENRTSRDYLYGRLLALADSLEEWALNLAGEKRETNAARLMQRFAERPYSTWRTIELALGPYKSRLGGKSKKRQQLIDEVIAAFEHGDFVSDKRLSGEFLLGYHCQREYLRIQVGNNHASDDDNENK